MNATSILLGILLGLVLTLGLTQPNQTTHKPTTNNPTQISLENPAPLTQTKHTPLGHGYSRQGDHIYFNGQRIDQAGRDTFAEFQRQSGRRFTLADNVDAASFTALSEQYAKDNNTVYYKWISPGRFWVVKIPGADPATFEFVDFNLAKDARRVYRTDIPVKGAQPATVQVVNPGWVWKDQRTVYYQFTPLRGADPDTFRHLNQGFYADAKHVYWCDTRLDGADLKTFRTFGNDIPYAVDKNHVWSAKARLTHLDAGSFRLLHNHVLADKNGVYVSIRGLSVIDADSATFQKIADLESLDCVLFRDARHAYIFDPGYNEIYTLARTEQGFLISKPVWYSEAAGHVRHAATVSATWSNGSMTQPTVQMQPAFKGPQTAVPAWEPGKMQRMIDAIREALTLLENEPVA